MLRDPQARVSIFATQHCSSILRRSSSSGCAADNRSRSSSASPQCLFFQQLKHERERCHGCPNKQQTFSKERVCFP
jgi:hypothetical protein